MVAIQWKVVLCVVTAASLVMFMVFYHGSITSLPGRVVENMKVHTARSKAPVKAPVSLPARQKLGGKAFLKWVQQKHDKKTVNVPLNTLRENGISINLADTNLDKMTDQQLRLTAHSILDNTDTICARKLRMGNLADGGWEICDDPDVAPEPPCIIYSLGINNDFTFDDDAAKVYGCHVYSFDPSMKQKDYNRSKLVHFYQIGIGGTTRKGKWDVYTLNDLKKKLGHQNSRIDILKMDVESAEWESVPEMVSSGALDTVRQLLMEFHITSTSRAYLLPRLKMIQTIEKHGFKKFFVSKNFHCPVDIESFVVKRTQCYEVHYVRRP